LGLGYYVQRKEEEEHRVSSPSKKEERKDCSFRSPSTRRNDLSCWIVFENPERTHARVGLKHHDATAKRNKKRKRPR
jgi:hypothetical protein